LWSFAFLQNAGGDEQLRKRPFSEVSLVLQGTLKRLIKVGSLQVVMPNGKRMTFGEAADPVIVRLHDRLTPLKLAVWPDLYLGEAYMDGKLTVENGSLWDLLDLLGRNLARQGWHHRRWPARALYRVLRFIHQYNSLRASKKNVARHYDLPFEMYEKFLDGDLQYSCAYFVDPNDSLETAQGAKKRHIAAKLLLKPGQKVLDIGSGWGGMALTLARREQVDVTGITLSQAQLDIARARARTAGLEGRVRFERQDYREISGKFDRIVSVGMLEHVGAPNFGTFFQRVSELLADDGVALIHAIGRASGPDVTSAFIRKYIFPGGYIPALSQILPHVEHSDLWVTDIEILRLHYADTLRAWRTRFLAHADGLVDTRFRRMWEYYLAICEMSFRYGDLMVFQLQVAKRIDAVPRLRDYMFDTERQPVRLASVPEPGQPDKLRPSGEAPTRRPEGAGR
jgi:cyclopropane-fatty-acyl-phospholipid synthase